ncbi:hypothetical protein [Halopiger goleimassiliensis]|uniref:hypothetical protein n=1 Tax=Halopiger goleimassiliensis TaxID=1293048 RepID=UPI0006781BC4|nr:hypothetical protein [Halopiger goleimassiliensis]
MPSHKANKYGTACEYHLAEKYGVELERSSWHDGVKNGVPWEFKATKRTHADGQPGNFKIYREYHERLQEAGGHYGFAVYRIRGRGCEVLATTTIAASRLPMVRWHGGGSHRGTEQAKVSIEDVF